MDIFTKANLRLLDAELLAALQPIVAKHGISVRTAGGSFGSLKAIVKFEVAIPMTKASPEAAAAALRVFTTYASFVGLKPDALGKSFDSRGHSYTVTGIEPGRPSFPISATRADGKQFKFPVSALPAALRAAP